MLLDRLTRARSIQDLDGEDWGDPEPDNPSALARRCKLGRRVPLEDLDPVTVKMMLGQEIGVKWLVPLALERLLVEPWIDTEDRGLLIEAILRLPDDYWGDHPQPTVEWERIIDRALLEAGGARGNRARRYNPEIIFRLESLRRDRQSFRSRK